MSDCPDLKPVESDALIDFKRAGNQWVNAYGTCRLKHEILRECLKAYEKD